MKRLAIACAAVWALLALPFNPAGAALARRAGHPQVLPGLARAPLLGRLPGETRLGVAVVLAARNPDGLSRLIAAQADPASPEYLRYLTPEEFGRRFGASEADCQALADYLRLEGLQVTQTSPSRLCILAQGTASQMERAFDVRLNRYLWDGREAFANDRTPSLPANLGAELLSVEGLTNALRLRSFDGGNPPFTPRAISRIYNLRALHEAGFNGAGQAIAIYSLCDFSDANLAYYAAHVNDYASPPGGVYDVSHITRVRIDNGDGTFGASEVGGEADLDAEICLGAMPGANVQVWLARNASAGCFNMYVQFANQTAVKVMTCSWGMNESSYLPDNVASLEASHQVFAQAASEGLSIFQGQRR